MECSDKNCVRFTDSLTMFRPGDRRPPALGSRLPE